MSEKDEELFSLIVLFDPNIIRISFQGYLVLKEKQVIVLMDLELLHTVNH